MIRRPRPMSWLVAALLLAAPQLGAQQVTGRVVDQSSGQPMSAVQISIPGTGIGSLSQASGRYLLLNVPVGTHTLTAQRIGFRTQTIQVSVTAGATVIQDFRLSEEALGLDEIIVTGTPGGTQRRAIGNSVLSVSATDISQNVAVSGIQDLLSGRTPGLQFTRVSGTIGTGSGIQVRGAKSFNLSSDPLVYVDGIRINANSQSGPSLGDFREVNPLNDLNPADIESVEIIKGPAAATLYGTEASAGVIQIITKRGAEGSAVFDASIRAGSNWMVDPAGKIGPMWACTTTFGGVCDEKTGGLFEFNAYDEANISLRNGDDKGFWGQENLYQNGHQTSYDLSVRGGTAAMRYFLSGNYDNEEGIVFYNTDETFRLRANVNAVFSPKVTMDVSTGFVNGMTRFMAQAETDGGEWEDLVWGNGYCITSVNPGACQRLPGVFQEHMPSDVAKVKTTREYSRFTGSGTLNLTPFSWLSSRAIVGIDKGWDENVNLYPKEVQLTPVNPRQVDGTIIVGRPITTNLSMDWSATGKHPITDWLGTSTSVGAQYYRKVISELRTTGVGFASPLSTTVNQTAPASSTLYYNYIENKSIGFYVQEEISFRDRIFVTGAVRFDDNSAFGSAFDLEKYPKLAATWTMSDESFWKLGLVNSFRVRGAWGKAGRQPDTFAGTNQFGVISGVGNTTSLNPVNSGNPNVGPETSTELELGFDVAFFDDKLSGEFSWFNTRNENSLLSVTLAPSAGGSGSVQQNLGRIDSWGWEGSLNAKLYESRAVGVNLAITADHVMNEIKSLGDFPGNFQIKVGFPYPNYEAQYWVTDAEYVAGGPIQDGWGQRIQAYCDNGVKLGDGPQYGRVRGGERVKCEAVSKDPILYGPAFNTYRISGAPNISLFNNALSLTAMIEGAFGKKNLEGDSGFTYNNAYEARTERNPRWVAIDRLGGTERTYWLYDASFWKLRELGARYNLPNSLAERVGADRASLAVSARGLKTLWVKMDQLCAPPDLGTDKVWCKGENITDPEMGTSVPGGRNYRITPPTADLNVTLRVTF